MVRLMTERPIPNDDRIMDAIRESEQERTDLYELLLEVESYLDDCADTVDGDDGTPRPNRAMSLQARVLTAIVRLQPEEQS